MNAKPLTHLVAEAMSLAGVKMCAMGHEWESEGGRACPYDLDNECSQPVYQCKRCGAIDYGGKGGYAWETFCVPECEHRRQ